MILGLLTPKELRRGTLVGGLMAVSALLETIGVASVIPFLAVLGSPEIARTDPRLRSAYEVLGMTSVDDFLLVLGVASLAMVLVSALIRLVTEYAMVRFVEMRRHSLSTRLFRRYLGRPYTFFLGRNSADLSKSLLSEVDVLVNYVFRPCLRIPAFGLLAGALVVLLVIVDASVARVVALLAGTVYLGIYFSVSRMLERRGQDRLRANRERFTAASEAFGGIKALKLTGREEFYLKRFLRPSLRFSRHKVAVGTLSVLPRYVVEALAFGGILALTVFLMATGKELGGVLPVLGVYALAASRLLPAVQQIYTAGTNLRFGLPTVANIHADLYSESRTQLGAARQRQRLSLDDRIQWLGVSYTYPESENVVIHDLSLEIPARSSVAIVGGTGAGKTTVVDLTLGLLRPRQGEIRVDGVLLDEATMRQWQDSIGYVPQDIYLSDNSVAANIAFGVPEREIDYEAIERAAGMAQLHEFIAEQLPHGYETVVGERGVRLSGGQRQRLGIARALYADPTVLILDEATSSLDTTTERAVMESIARLEKDRTIILIAHRLTTVRDVDRIFLLEEGRLVGVGSFDELLRDNSRFRTMAAGVTNSDAT